MSDSSPLPPPPLVVIDTSVILSGLAGADGGADAWVLDAVGTGEVEPAVSLAGIREFYAKIGSPKLRAAISDTARAVRFALDLVAMGRMHHPERYAWPTMPDEKDWWVLDLAYDAAVDYVVTYDHHFLDRSEELLSFGFRVVSPEHLRGAMRSEP